MRRTIAVAALLLGLWSGAGPARAGVYTDDLSKCLVQSTNAEDQSALVVWIFMIMSAHPAIQSYSSVTEAQRAAATKRAAELFQRLLIVDCHGQTVAALKYEGTSVFEAAFSVLGQAAMRGLMTDPQVAQHMGELQNDFDRTKFEALGKEAGLASPAASPSK